MYITEGSSATHAERRRPSIKALCLPIKTLWSDGHARRAVVTIPGSMESTMSRLGRGTLRLTDAADKWPDAVAAIQYKGGGHIFKVSGLGRILSIDPDAPGAVVVAHDSTFGFGIQGDLKLALTSAFAVYAHAMWGDGAGRCDAKCSAEHE